MDYSHYCLLLLLVSLALLVLEVFVPSGGFIGLLMLAALAGSIVCGFYAWWDTSRGLWWGYLVSVLILLPGVLVGAFAIFPRTRYGQRILLNAPKSEEITPYAKEQNELQKLIGETATAVTPHRPSGLISVSGRRYHAETRGMMLEAGDVVTIVALRGNRLVVRLSAEPGSEELMDDELVENVEQEDQSPNTAESKPDRRRREPFDPFVDDSETT